MSDVPPLCEVYGVTSRQTQHQIIDALQRKRTVTASENRLDGHRVVIVECADSRAQWVFRTIMSIDPGAVLIQAEAPASAFESINARAVAD
jgi:hypothetical protein